MADGGVRNILCRYYLSNACRDGSNCRFSHDRATGVVDNMCRFYQKGECRYGNRCRYDHVKKLTNGNKEVIALGRITKEAIEHNSNPDLKNANAIRSVHGSTSSLVSAGPSANEGKTFSELLKADMDPETAEYRRLSALPLCDTHMVYGTCKDTRCKAVHGNLCEFCNKYILHPYNPDQESKHKDDCEKQQELERHVAEAIAKSAELSCGICMDVVLQKDDIAHRRFGILESCSHIFCLSCIREWRRVKGLNSKTIRGCPECRVSSDFVTPSAYFVDTGDEKTKLINDYKTNLSRKPCKYFKQGAGSCPFANKCFYKHSLPDGSLAPDSGPPSQRRRLADAASIVNEIMLWDYMGAHIDEDVEDLFGLEAGQDLGFDIYDAHMMYDSDDFEDEEDWMYGDDDDDENPDYLFMV